MLIFFLARKLLLCDSQTLATRSSEFRAIRKLLKEKFVILFFMDKDDGSSHSWFQGLRRKFQKKFKRNRQKLESAASSDDILDEEPEIPVPINNFLEVSETATASNVDSNPLSAQDCEEMKRELSKLSWYWPNLSRLDAQKILSASPNGSFLIRDSSQKDSFTLSFRTNSKTFHCRNQW